MAARRHARPDAAHTPCGSETLTLLLVRERAGGRTGWLRFTWDGVCTRVHGSLGLLARGSDDAVDLDDPVAVLAWAERQGDLDSIHLTGPWPTRPG